MYIYIIYVETHTVLYHRRCVLAISIHMYTYTWYTDSEIDDTSQLMIRASTLSRYKRHNMNPRARCNVNGRGKWRRGCPTNWCQAWLGSFSNDFPMINTWHLTSWKMFSFDFIPKKHNHIRTWSKWRFPRLTHLLLNGLFSAFTCRVSQERKEVLGPVSMGIPLGAPRFLAQCGVHHGFCRSCWNPGVLPRPPMIPQAMARCFDGWWICRCLVGATLVICQTCLEVALVDTSW